MNPKYRSRIEIISSILEASVGGVKKSKVMCRSFVSNTQFKNYMNHLIEKNLLSIDSEGKLTITTKGLDFLDHYHALENMLDLTIQKQYIKNDAYSNYLLST
ncbi:MAG TPA: winged helix-turn-helix domain-containing protein [Nitrososphaeraceae archaeon]|nr:winged helix-turn-helix domain-containing protein [Nitrososphaeraceae archaeon]